MDRPEHQRIVITGVGLTAPNGNSLPEFRQALLEGRSGVVNYDIRYFGPTLAGVCNFDELRYQKRKEVRRGTRAGGIGIFCAHEAIADAGLDWENVDRSTVGIYVGVTEHGNVETENEILPAEGVRLRHAVLVAPPQPAHGGQQPGGRDFAEPRHHRAALHARRRLRRGQRRHDPGRADAAAGRLRHRPVAAASRKAFTPSASSPASIAKGPWPRTTTPRRRRAPSTSTATASSWPRGAACTCSNGSATPAPAARRSTARSSATR